MSTKKSVFRMFSVLLALALMVSALGVTPAHAAGIRYATPGGTGDCSSWATACTLQTALTGATSGDEIWAAAGTYKPTTGTDRTATFQLINGVALYGGFAGTETARDQRNPSSNVTILSGDIDNNDSQTPIITNLTTVTGNTTNSYHVVTGATGVTLDGFTITAGNANGDYYLNHWGGGMYNESSSPTLMNVIFSGNSALGGGGMYNYNSSNPTLANVTFSNNSATDGGGMINGYSNPTLTNVAFSGNSASWGGGGMENGSSSPVLTNVTFSSNSANRGGGMFNSSSSSPTLTNVTFSGNSADIGGGVSSQDSSSMLTNVTFSDNFAANEGGGMYNIGSSPQIRNTIFWGNTAPIGAQISNGGSAPSVSDSVVQSGCPAGSTCTNIISADPLLGTLGDYGGFTQTIPLLAGSSAIDATSSNCPATDQRGQPRSNPTCDIGAYEVQTILLAVPSGQTNGLCESWANACELSYALTSVTSGQEIWAAAGIYKPTTGTDRSATFQLKNGVAVYGGFAGTETARSQRNPTVNVATLSGDLNGDDVGFTNNSENVYHVVTGATGATLDGFTITAGNANGTDPNNSGAGMYNSSSSPTLTNITFSNNSASGGGGGMWNDLSNPTMISITFSNNSANLGGGINNFFSSPTLTNVTFSNNSASYGGGMYNNSGNPTMTNVTFSGNAATYNGGGMENDSYSYPIIRNTIFWGNTASTEGAAQMYNDSSLPVMSFSVVQGGCPVGSTCTDIIITDPLLGPLVNNGGFTRTIPLLANSSAIDTGNDAICPATDQRGVARPQGTHCDIGAVEGISYLLYLPLSSR